MTQPKLANLALWGEANAYAESRAYRDPRDGKHFPSVTSILKLVHKDLTQYAADTQLRWCIENWQFLGGRSDEQAFRGARYRWKEHAEYRGEIGDGVHNYIEAEHTGSWDFPELNPEQDLILEQWRLLNEAHDLQPLRNEITVADTDLGWFGTFDCYCLLDGVPTVVDWKTSKGIYDTALMQLAALYNAKVWFIETEEMKWEAIDPEPVEEAAVVHLRSDKWAIVPVQDIDLHYSKFKHYAGIWWDNYYLKERAKEREQVA